MHIKAVDLNLFRVFVALFEEKSATRAGARLGLSQSAVSHALRRLRELIGDELFVRGRTGLRPTQRGLEIAETARAALRMLELAVADSRFEPGVDRYEFNVAANSYIAMVLMPAVAERLVAEAPRARLRIRHFYPGMAEDLDRGRLDLIIGSFAAVPPRFTETPLFSESGVWVLRAGHPATKGPLTPETLTAWPRILMSSAEDLPAATSDLGLKRLTTLDDQYALSTDGEQAGAPVTAPDAFCALTMVSRSDMIALLPRRLARLASDRGNVILVEPTVQPEPVHCSAVARAGDGAEGATGWLLDLVQGAARGL